VPEFDWQFIVVFLHVYEANVWEHLRCLFFSVRVDLQQR
jgi:hypothetical protein